MQMRRERRVRETVARSKQGKPIRVLVADDQELVRSGYKAILNTFSNIEVVGMAKDGKQAVDEALRLRPDVVLMDIRMPEENGIEATKRIVGNPLLEDVHVLVLTTFDVDEHVYDALEAGASGFLLKDADPEDIAEAIEVVAAGDALIQPSVMKRLIQTFARTRPVAVQASAEDAATRVSTLTDREREILVAVARGADNAQIAEDLFISPATVKTHLARIMSKTSSHDRAQLVVVAYESGLVRPGY